MQTALSPEEIAHLSAQLATPDPNIPQGEADDIQPARIEEAVALFRDLVFPGFFTARPTLECLSQLSRILYRQIEAARCVVGETCCAKALTQQFMQAIPALRNTLGLDVRAIYNGDPAAASHTEVILCYPSVQAIVHYRMAHVLHRAGVPIVPRIISELAHARTGIDIHPGAEIGPEFAIDHGTGVVIGATCIIGRGVRLYQGVTLGARSFKTADDGTLLNLPRHPIIEDGVVIYSNASVLGRITVGYDTVIGGNVWVTHSVPPHSRVLQSKVTLGTDFDGGAGI